MAADALEVLITALGGDQSIFSFDDAGAAASRRGGGQAGPRRLARWARALSRLTGSLIDRLAPFRAGLARWDAQEDGRGSGLQTNAGPAGGVGGYENHARGFQRFPDCVNVIGGASARSQGSLHASDGRQGQAGFRGETRPAPINERSRRADLRRRQHAVIPKVWSAILLD